MRCVVQRVTRAQVRVEGDVVADMGPGLLALVGVGHDDDEASADELARKLVHLRVFEDEAGKLNRSLVDCGYALGVVSQFTLLADTRKGRRPSFADAAPPERAEPLVERVAAQARVRGVTVVTGRFRAHMEVELVNDGPVTLWLDSAKKRV